MLDQNICAVVTHQGEEVIGKGRQLPVTQLSSRENPFCSLLARGIESFNQRFLQHAIVLTRVALEATHYACADVLTSWADNIPEMHVILGEVSEAKLGFCAEKPPSKVDEVEIQKLHRDGLH